MWVEYLIYLRYLCKTIAEMADKKSAFDIFMVEEYKNISNAHYNTGSSISQFFRYYLILMPAVIAVLPVLLSSKFDAGGNL